MENSFAKLGNTNNKTLKLKITICLASQIYISTVYLHENSCVIIKKKSQHNAFTVLVFCFINSIVFS